MTCLRWKAKGHFKSTCSWYFLTGVKSTVFHVNIGSKLFSKGSKIFWEGTLSRYLGWENWFWGLGSSVQMLQHIFVWIQFWNRVFLHFIIACSLAHSCWMRPLSLGFFTEGDYPRCCQMLQFCFYQMHESWPPSSNYLGIKSFKSNTNIGCTSAFKMVPIYIIPLYLYLQNCGISTFLHLKVL